MKIVLLFFCGILIFISLAGLLLIFSKIKLNIKKVSITNIEKGRKQKGLSKEFEIYLELYILGFIKIARIKLTKKLAEKFKVKEESPLDKRGQRGYNEIANMISEHCFFEALCEN